MKLFSGGSNGNIGNTINGQAHHSQSNRNIINVRAYNNERNNNYNNNYQNHRNRNSRSPTPSSKSDSPPITASTTEQHLKPCSTVASPAMTLSSLSSGSNQSNESLTVTKSNSHSPALSTSSSNSVNNSAEFVSMMTTAAAEASSTENTSKSQTVTSNKRIPVAITTNIKKKSTSDTNSHNTHYHHYKQRPYLSDSDSSHSSGSTKHRHIDKTQIHQIFANGAGESAGNNRASSTSSSNSSSNGYVSKQKEATPSCCQDSSKTTSYQQNLPSYPMDLFLIRTDEHLRTQPYQQIINSQQNLSFWNLNYNQSHANYLYGSTGSLDLGFAYASANDITQMNQNNYNNYAKRKLTGRTMMTNNMVNSSNGNGQNIFRINNSVNQNRFQRKNNANNNNNHNNNNRLYNFQDAAVHHFTPPDRFLARSHLVELKDAPKQLLNGEFLFQNSW
jgi:hypothetical protein